jgi:hypothetical protein
MQRWERDFGLPVRRPVGSLKKSQVLLYACDLDAWLARRALQHGVKGEAASTHRAGLRSGLGETIRTAKELTATRRILVDQIEQSVRQLAERCEVLTRRTVTSPFDHW